MFSLFLQSFKILKMLILEMFKTIFSLYSGWSDLKWER